MNQKKFDYNFSLALIGRPSTGKTNVFKRMLPFGSKYDWDNTIKPTRQIDFLMDSRGIDDQSVQVIIWDTGRRISKANEKFYQQVCGFLVVYDITNRESLEETREWIEKIQDHNKGREMPQIFLIGNKSDLEEERNASFEEGRVLAEEYGVRFFEVSAKTSENIEFVLKMFKREEIAKIKEKEQAQKTKETKEMEEKKHMNNKFLGMNYLYQKKSVLSVFSICAGLFCAYLLQTFFGSKPEREI